MTCREIGEFLMQYLDGELDCAQLAEFEEHLSLCPDCVHYLHSYRDAVTLGRMAWLCPEDGPGAVPEQLVQAILAARSRQN